MTVSVRLIAGLFLIVLSRSTLSTAQTALPYTMSTVGGGLVPTTYTPNTTLCPGSSTVKSMTAYGDGCAAIAGNFGAAGRGGVVVDSYGNIFVADDINKIAHMIDANTGIMSVLAGGGTTCAGKIDSLGDGCLAATQTSFSAASALRGIGIDPYGNVVLAGYNTNGIHIVCRAASPLCTSGTPVPSASNPIQVQVGSMGLVAGCMASTTGVGTAGVGLDNNPGFSTAANSLAAFKNSGACSTSLGEASGPRGATADLYGNVYYADTNTSRTRVILGPLTSSYFSGNNPLYAALKTHWASPTAGYVYTVVNHAGTSTTTGGAATVTGNSCSDSNSGTTYTGTAADIRGDGCPYWLSAVDAASGFTSGVAVDAAGNMVFTDPGNGSTVYGGLRILFVQGWASSSAATSAGATGSVATAGVAMYKAIGANNSGVTPQPGFVYSLAGGSGMQTSPAGAAPFSTPILGNSSKIVDSTITKLTVSPQGNIYIGDNTKVLFYDIYTGTIRVLLSSSGTASTVGNFCHGSSGAVAKTIYGDGCPVAAAAPYAEFGNGNGLGVAVDGQDNLYMYDGTSYGSGMLIRKVLAQGMGVQSTASLAALGTVTTAYPLQSLGTTQTQTFTAHFPSATAASAVLTNSANANFSYGTPSCTWYNTVDNSADCTIAVTYTPTAAGLQSAGMTLAASGGESATLSLAGTVTGSVLAVDSATSAGTPLLNTSALFSGNTPAAIAVDGGGNVYAASGASILESVAASPSSAQVLVSNLSAAPTKMAVDQAGNIYYLNGSSQIQVLSLTSAGLGSAATYSPSTIAYTPSNLGTATPAALAVDRAGNLLVADEQSGAGTIYRLSPSALNVNSQTDCSLPATSSVLPSLCQSTVFNAGAFGSISALAVDPAGDVYVADATNNAVYKLTPGVDETSTDSNYKQFVYVESTLLSSIFADALAVDAAGDLYVQTASGSNGVMEYPLSGPTNAGVTVLNSVSTPAGIAVDGQGNLYSADGSSSSVTQVQRGAIVENFGSSQTTEFIGTLTNVGNQVSTKQTTAPTSGAQAGDFTLAGTSSNGCTFSTNLLSAMAPGQACGLTAYFPALGNTQETDHISFTATAPASASAGVLTLTGLADTEAFTTATAIGTPSTNAPVYSTGTEISFPVTVTASSTSTDGIVTNNTQGPTTSDYVTVSVDSGPTANYNFTSTNGLSASLQLDFAGLSAGTHSFKVTFPQQGELLTSNATSSSFTIAQVTTATTWNPAASTQQVSAAIGAGTLNAVSSPTLPGNFVYTTTGAVNCATTTAATIDASTYLPIGSYTLYATFCPADLTDYVPSSTSISYTVTKASTTATVGASTMVVAASGGNYTNLAAALEALPTTGGTIYVAPGVYSGQNVVSYPNVKLRGLGGDPTQVIITGENGNFSSTALPAGFSLGPAGKGGDEGSATLDVGKNAFIGTQSISSTYTPNNFYAEYLTIQNTYDTDPTTTTTETATSNGGTCSNGATAHTLQFLYNNNQECGSQALALFLNSDGAVLNNVNLLSQQDTLYASGIGCGTFCTVAREYMWRGTIVGDVDYVFGDAALVFDHTNFFTTWHGLTATGQETIEAQNKRFPTGNTSTTNSSSSTSTDYLSGFICNGCTLMSQSTGMTKLYYGRPWDISPSTYPSSYSTWIMLNSFVDQVNPQGWIGWDGASEYLSTATYGEYNTQRYTDPAAGTVPYPFSIFNSTPSLLYTPDSANSTANSLVPAGGNTGSYGVVTTSATPANREANALTLTAAEAVSYYPWNFLSTTVPSTKLSPGQVSNWDPVGALATQVNSFAPTGSVGALTFGSSVTILGRPQTPGAGAIPTGAYAFYDSGTNQVCSAPSATCAALASGSLDASGEAYLITTSLTSGDHYITMVYGGDTNFTGSTSSTYHIFVLLAGQTASSTTLAVNNTSSTTGTAITGTVAVSPSAATGAVSLVLDGVTATTCTLASGSCSWSLSGVAAGSHTLYASYPGDSSYGPSASSSVTLAVSAGGATGDTRTVTEPAFPPVCQQLSATLATDPAIQDLDATVDSTTTNIDGARIQAALNACSAAAVASNLNLGVQLSMDGTGTNNAFLSGPLSMPSNVTLLVDPGVTLYFSRNVQDYDKVSGTPTCGTINAASATSSCRPLIDIPATSTNVGIMGYGKLNGRGGDPLFNAFFSPGYTPPPTYTWWTLAAQANGEGNQQNPRFLQMEAGSSNITLYKITILNSPNFHVSTQGLVTNFTAWDVKIVTPTSARNTDGIDPANVQNATIIDSWISDGDDNVAVSAPGTTAPAQNISVIYNHFYAGHGESIGSYTGAGVSNILFDHNVSAGNGFANFGSATLTGTADGNSTAIRIKSANDRGGLVTGIQYSNSCFLDHKTDIEMTPYYNSNDSTSLFPSYTNILMQNLVFANDNSNRGTVEFTGEYNTNNGTPVTNPISVTLDNVTFPSALTSLVNSSTPVEPAGVWSNGNYSGGQGQYANLAVGPGQVSSNFISAFNALAANSANFDTLTNNITLSNLNPPACTITYLAPELTGPSGVPETLAQGSTATLDVILTPTVGGAPYPTGTVTVTDALTSNTFNGTFNGTGDTLAITIPASDLTVGTHTFSATAYTGDANYTVPPAYQTFGSYVVTVVHSLATVTLNASSNPVLALNPVTFTATVASSSGIPTGTVTFIDGSTQIGSGTVNNGVASFTTSSLTVGSHAISAVYSGDANFPSASSAILAQVIAVRQSPTTLTITSGLQTVLLQNPVTFTATIGSIATGTPTGSVNFLDGSTLIGTATVVNGVASFTTTALGVGAHTISAAYGGDLNFAPSTSGTVTETVITIVITQIGVNSQTVSSNGTALYTLLIAPSSGTTFPSTLTLSISGLPPGAAAAVAPSSWVRSNSPSNTWTLPANTAIGSNTAVYILMSRLSSSMAPGGSTLASRLAPLALGMVLLPFAGRMRRVAKPGRRVIASVLLVIASIAAIAGVSGCGGSTSNAPQNQTYNVTVTVSSGSLSQSSTFTLVQQ